MPRFLAPLLGLLVLGCCLVGLGLPEAQGQSRRGQQAPAQRQMAPSGGAGHAPSQAARSNPAGTGLPSYAQPSSPPSFGQPPSSGGNPSGGQAQTSSGPGLPNGGGPVNQVPLGGVEYLAAAGAAYALNRLRKRNGGDEDEEAPSAV